MKDIILTLLCVIVLFVAGCSHNANFVASGKVFKIGTEAAGLLYVNGLVAVNGTRENSESIIEAGDDDGLSGAPTVDAKTLRTIRFRTGPQLTGYLVDLSKKSPVAAEAYVKQMYRLNTATWDSKETLKDKTTTKKSGEKSTTDNYIEYLKEKLKSVIGKDTKVEARFTKDGDYNELWKDATITTQAAMCTELISMCDDSTYMTEDEGETIRETLVHYAGRLAQLKAKGKTETRRIVLSKVTVKGGKVTFLRYRLYDEQTGEVSTDDEICPTCYGVED